MNRPIWYLVPRSKVSDKMSTQPTYTRLNIESMCLMFCVEGAPYMEAGLTPSEGDDVRLEIATIVSFLFL